MSHVDTKFNETPKLTSEIRRAVASFEKGIHLKVDDQVLFIKYDSDVKTLTLKAGRLVMVYPLKKRILFDCFQSSGDAWNISISCDRDVLRFTLFSGSNAKLWCDVLRYIIYRKLSTDEIRSRVKELRMLMDKRKPVDDSTSTKSYEPVDIDGMTATLISGLTFDNNKSKIQLSADHTTLLFSKGTYNCSTSLKQCLIDTEHHSITLSMPDATISLNINNDQLRCSLIETLGWLKFGL
jgi:hypothetical protein